MLFQAFENDIELRLELQFCIENHCVFFKDIFCMMVMFNKLASRFNNFDKFIKLTGLSHKEQIHKMLAFLSLRY
jgi:hypothetical protein